MPTPDRLDELGWTDGVAARWSRAATGGLLPARAARTDRGIVTLWPAPGTRVRATMASAATDVVAGDWVGFDPETRRVDAVVERTTAFERLGSRGSTHVQTLAANMDVVLLVEAAHPKVNERRLERALVLAHQSGAEPVVVVTKIDLVDDPAGVLEIAGAVAPNVRLIGVSNRSGEGLDELRSLIGPRITVAALGASGVGKSSLVNSLAGADEQATGAVRRGDAKGRHTTTAARLIDLGGFLYIDTPGIRALALCGDGTGLDLAFPEITEAAKGCQFSDCSHRSEPGCAVRPAVDAGAIRRDRFDHYQQLWDELITEDQE